MDEKMLLEAIGAMMDQKLDERDKQLDQKLDERDKRLSDMMDRKFDERDKQLDQKLAERDKQLDQKLAERDKQLDQKLDERDKRLSDMMDRKLEAALAPIKKDLQMVKHDVKEIAWKVDILYDWVDSLDIKVRGIEDRTR